MSELTTVRCSEAHEMLGAYLDGELAPLDDLRIEVHLEACASCRAEHGSLSELTALLREEGSEVDMAPAWEGLLERLEPGAAHPPLPPGGLARASKVSLVLGAVAASFFLGVFGGSVLTHVAPRGTEALPGASELVRAAGIPALDAYLTEHRAREVPLEELPRFVDFEPHTPRELPGGFRIERSYVVRERELTNTCLVYRRGDETVGLLQHQASLPSTIRDGRSEERSVGGVSCRIVRRGATRVLQIDPPGTNLTLVLREGSADVDDLVRYLGRGALR